MDDNHRDSFTNRNDDDRRNDDPAQRWRRSEERYRREAQGAYGEQSRNDEDRFERSRYRDFGYGRGYRDDDQGGRSNVAGRAEGRAQRGYYGNREAGHHDDGHAHWHEREHELRAGHPYRGTYGGTGDSSYFDGSQGSWGVPSSDRTPTSYGYSGQSFGADYRSHGYDQRDADNDGRRGFWDRASDEVASWFGDDDAARRREQDHRGRGPKDYTRSDERIREDANDKLTEDWRVDASEVTVTVKDGEITLNGTVTSREAKRRAEDVVDSLSGVKHVQNNLRVQDIRSGDWTQNRTSTAAPGVASRSDTVKTDKP